MPPMRITRPSARRVDDRVLLRARVGGHDRPCRLPRRGPRATWLQGGDDGLHGGYRKPRADEAGRGREDLVRLAAEASGGRSHDRARVVQSAGTGPGVRAAGVHDDPAHGRGAGGERLLGQQHRRRPHQVGGERRRRACRPVGRQQHQVGAARLADAGHADGHREALRGRDPSGDDGCAHGWTPSAGEAGRLVQPERDVHVLDRLAGCTLAEVVDDRDHDRASLAHATAVDEGMVRAGGLLRGRRRVGDVHERLAVIRKVQQVRDRAVVEVVARATGSRSPRCRATAARGAGRRSPASGAPAPARPCSISGRCRWPSSPYARVDSVSSVNR